MKLAKALKVKNRIAGDIAQAVKLINESNVVEGDNKPAHAVPALIATMIKRQDELAKLKGQISVANGPISEKIFLLAELKARTAFWRALPTKNGKFLHEGRYGSESVEREYKAAITADVVENNVKELQKRIETLQDEIDEFNATTEIK